MTDKVEHIWQYDKLSLGEKYSVKFDPETYQMVQQPPRALLSTHDIQQENGLYASLNVYTGIAYGLVQDMDDDIPEGRDRIIFIFQTWLGGKGNPDYRIPLTFSEKKVYRGSDMSSGEEEIKHWLYEHEIAIINKIVRDVQNIDLKKIPAWINLNSDNHDPGRKVIKVLFTFDNFVARIFREVEKRARRRFQVYQEALTYCQESAK